ncbi:MAG: SLBB domain-containing protein [Prevotella sp.]|nr:SLBB domain-containing protein [Prevotella sp.]
MSDSQVLEFYAREIKAGTSQSQIVTKLIQRGVKVDQIRRLRDQYGAQMNGQSQTKKNTSTGNNVSTLRRNNEPATTSSQQYVTGKQTETGVYPTDRQYTQGDIWTDVNMQPNMQPNMEPNMEPNMQSNMQYNMQSNMQYNMPPNMQYNMQPGVNQGYYPYFQDVDLDKVKKVFGRDIFNQRALSFEPNMNIATPENYVLGPGDQVIIDIYGASQKNLQLEVSPEGTVTVPDYGPIQIGGMSVAAANAKIRRSLGSRYSSSEIKLTVGQTRTILVNVMGEVRLPGTYTLSAFATVFHALYLAGGINDLGTLRNIRVYRGGRLITVVDIYEYILNGRLAGNIRLQENDVIQVGVYDCLVDVAGNVKRPMSYEMRRSESVGTLIKYAGGFSGDAYKKAVRLIRKTGEKYAVYTVDEFDMNSFRVDDGDSITVDGILDRYDNMVEIKGAVFRPGKYQLGKGITSVRSLIQQAEGVTEEAFTAHAILHRMKSDRTLEAIPVDVQGIMQGTVADQPLRNEDVLFIPTKSDRISDRTLTIGGEVFSPGIYQYAANTTIEDLIMQAGGLTDAASTAKVDVSRRIVDPKATTSSKEISKTFTFSVKDGFVVDGSDRFTLEPYDVVQVRRSPGFQTPRMITVSGEVMFEGSYTLITKNQRLSDAVNAAGGVTDQAYVRGARLEREMDDDEKARRDFLLHQLRMQSDDKDTININQLQLGDTYSVGIHLDEALAHPGSDADIQIREGDRLVVPEYNGVVKISGDVMFPNTVAYQAGKDYKWYVNQAGGFGNRARKSRTWIVYQNGTMSKVGRGVKVEPGCEIVVPSKPKRDGSRLTQWLTLGTSVTSMAAMIATLANALK